MLLALFRIVSCLILRPTARLLVRLVRMSRLVLLVHVVLSASVKVGPLKQEQVLLPSGISMETLSQAPSRGSAKLRFASVLGNDGVASIRVLPTPSRIGFAVGSGSNRRGVA